MSQVFGRLALIVTVLAFPKYLPAEEQAGADETLLRESGWNLAPSELLRRVKVRPASAGPRAIASQIERLGSDDFDTRDAASRALLALGPAALPTLRRATSGRDLEARSRAVACVRRLEADEAAFNAAVRALVRRRTAGAVGEMLRDGDTRLKLACLEALKTFGVHGRAETRAVLGAFADEAAARLAVEVLIKVASLETMPEFLHAAGDGNPVVRAGAVSLLYLFRDRPAQALPVLLTALKDKDKRVRRMAAGIVGGFAKQPRVVTALVAALKDTDVPESGRELSVAQYAASGLGFLVRAEGSALSALIEAARFGPEWLRGSALRALGAVGARDDSIARIVIPTIVAALESSDAAVRVHAAGAIYLLGSRGEEAVAGLRKALRADDVPDSPAAGRLRATVLAALGRIGERAASAAPDVINVLNDRRRDKLDRVMAAATMSLVGGGGAAGRAALELATGDSDPDVSDAAVKALRCLRP